MKKKQIIQKIIPYTFAWSIGTPVLTIMLFMALQLIFNLSVDSLCYTWLIILVICIIIGALSSYYIAKDMNNDEFNGFMNELP
jgi:TM2 domain-containing membrane protein YozV